MRLALVRQSYNAAGGAERFMDSALQSLTAHHPEVKIALLTKKWHGENNNADNPQAKPRYEVILCRPFSLGRAWRDWAFARAVRQHFHRFDVVQSHERVEGCHIFRAGDGLHIQWLLLRSRYRQQAIVHRLFKLPDFTAFSIYHHLLLARERAMMAHPNLKAVICNSQMVADEVARHYPEASTKTVVIANAVNPQRFSFDINNPKHQEERAALRLNMGIAADTSQSVFLFVGRGFERKGLPLILQAMAKSAPHAPLWVIGDDKNQRAMENRVKALGLTGVKFLGRIADTAPWYRAADVFVLPAIYDPQPNALLEALATGMPAIISQHCGGVEFLHQGCAVVDIFASADNAAATPLITLPHAIKKYADINVARAMRDERLEKILPLTAQKMAHQLVSLYQSFI